MDIGKRKLYPSYAFWDSECIRVINMLEWRLVSDGVALTVVNLHLF